MSTNFAQILSLLQQPQQPVTLSPQEKRSAFFRGLGALGSGLLQAGAPRVGAPGPGIASGLAAFAPAVQQAQNHALQRRLQQRQMEIQEQANKRSNMAVASQLSNAQAKELRLAKFAKDKDQIISGITGLNSQEKLILALAESASDFGNKLQTINASKSKEEQNRINNEVKVQIAKLKEANKAAKTKVVKVDGRQVLIDSQTGKKIKDLGVAPPSGFTINSGPGFGSKQDEELRKRVLAGPDIEAALAVERMGELLSSDDTQTGSVQSALVGLQGIADDIGVNLDSIAQKAGLKLGSLANKQEFRRLSNNLTLAVTERLKGSLSNAELSFAKKSVANLGDSEEANIRAIAAMKASNELAEERANLLAEEEEKTPNNRRSALNRFRRKRGNAVKKLRERTKEIAAEIRSKRLAADKEFKALSNDEIADRLREATTVREIRRIKEELKRRRNGN